MLLSILTMITILSHRKTTFMVAGVLVCLLLCHQKKARKTKPRLHLHGLPQVYPGSCPWQPSQYCSHCPTQQRKTVCDPSGCNPPQKHKPDIYYKNFSADSEQIPASCKSSQVMQLSQTLVPGLEMLKVGCAKENGNHQYSSSRFRDMVCAAKAHPKIIQWLCCAFGGHGKQGGNSARMWRVNWWLCDIINCNKLCWQLSQFVHINIKKIG